jgi:5-methylthioadenosine/S-adenosylhomocysteine deaminase
MKLKIDTVVFDADNIQKNAVIKLKSKHLVSTEEIECKESVAYSTFINSHEHLISNWYPRAGKNRPYPNADIWVEDMKTSESFLERNKVWLNDGSFTLHNGTAKLITTLGVYKNIFSGCTILQDHMPNQKDEYYDSFPINVIKKYKQCHTLSLGNWWGGKSPREEWEDSKGKMPFIIHLGEGVDSHTAKDFEHLLKEDLLQQNTILIHGISLTKDDIKKCAEAGTTICWCPESNLYLINKTLDVKACLEAGVNVILGTDSCMSGSINLIREIQIAHDIYPKIPIKEIYKMFTSNAQKALFLDEKYGKLSNETSNLVLLKKRVDDPMENLMYTKYSSDVQLVIHDGIPIYGECKYLSHFEHDIDDYFFFNRQGIKKFVIGHPEQICAEINEILGYHKDFPFLPF